jgi:hypothetical protein
MTFTTGKKPPQGRRGRKVGNRWYKILNPKKTLHSASMQSREESLPW